LAVISVVSLSGFKAWGYAAPLCCGLRSESRSRRNPERLSRRPRLPI